MNKQGGSMHVALVIVLVVAIIGALGYVVWQNYFTDDQATTEASVVEQDSDEAVATIPFESTLGYSVEVGDEFTAQADDGFDSFTLKSDDEPQRGMTVYGRSVDEQVEGTPEGYGGIDAAGRECEEIQVAGLPAVRLSDNPELLEDYWVYNEDRTQVVRVTIAAKDATDLALYTDLLATFSWNE